MVVRMLERPDDFLDITHVVLDEVHERTIDSDFLLVVLRRLMQKRPDLKLILMSATLEAQRFSTYLGGVPVLNIPGRTFPVEMKYLEDAIEMTNYRLSEEEANTTFDDEVDEMTPENVQGDQTGGALATLEGYSKQTRETVLNFDEYRMDYQLIKRLLIKIATAPEMAHYSKAILVFMPGMAEIRRLNDELLGEPTFQKNWIIHALHSSIASEDQEKAFNVPPEGTRKIVIATNIAETGMYLFCHGVSCCLLTRVLGITIPDITAVVDTGKEKTMRYVSMCIVSPDTANRESDSMRGGSCHGWLRRSSREPTRSNGVDEPDVFKTESASTCLLVTGMTGSYVPVHRTYWVYNANRHSFLSNKLPKCCGCLSRIWFSASRSANSGTWNRRSLKPWTHRRRRTSAGRSMR